jgi:hypothetical protein
VHASERINADLRSAAQNQLRFLKLEDDWKSVPMGEEGRVTHEDYWERITYFLEKTIPTAQEYDVRMACHPSDPPGLPFEYQGVDQWASPAIFEAIKRYESIVDSPYNDFQLDLGNGAAGLKNPATEGPANFAGHTVLRLNLPGPHAQSPERSGRFPAFAFGYGYIRPDSNG